MRTTLVLCDLDDGEARRPGVVVVEASIDGATYELDVCEEHAALLRALPAAGDKAPDTAPSYAGKDASVIGLKAQKSRARKPPAQRSGAAAKAPRASSQVAASGTTRRQPDSRRARQERIAQARAWARSRGQEVADRGRLPAGLLEEYEAAHL